MTEKGKKNTCERKVTKSHLMGWIIALSSDVLSFKLCHFNEIYVSLSNPKKKMSTQGDSPHATEPDTTILTFFGQVKTDENEPSGPMTPDGRCVRSGPSDLSRKFFSRNSKESFVRGRRCHFFFFFHICRGFTLLLWKSLMDHSSSKWQ